MITIARTSLFLGCLGVLAACGGEREATPPDQRTPAAPTTPPTPTAPGEPSAPTPAEPTAAPAAGSVATGCPATDPASVALPGTVHEADVSGAETWTLAGSPHRLPGGVTLQTGASLTIEPCARVIVGDQQGIWVSEGATLVAVGREGQPITFDASSEDTARGVWKTIHFAAGARAASKLHHVVIEEAGGDSGYPGAVYAEDGFVLDAQHLRIVRSGRNGVYLAGGARFAPGSTGLVVTESGTTEELTGPVRFNDASSVGSLPEGTYTGNATDDIVVETERVRSTATWRNPGAGVRYRLMQGLNVEGETGPILTVAPGTTLAFAPETTLWVGYGADGGLVLDGGGEDGRIVLTSARPVPEPGDWSGVHFGEHASRAASKLSYVIIRFAGRADGYDGIGCGDAAPAAITISGRDLGARIDHVKLEQLEPSSYAIARDYDAAAPTDYTAPALGMDFAGGQRCNQSTPRDAEGNCPETLPPCR